MSSAFVFRDAANLALFSVDRDVFFSFSFLMTVFVAVCIRWVFYWYNNGHNRCEKHTEHEVTEVSTIILFYNPKSGGYSGSHFLPDDYSSRTECICIDISNPNRISAIQAIVPTPQTRIIICGWVLQSITEAGWSFIPPCCILAMGTGNDLARTFHNYACNRMSFSDIITLVRNSRKVSLDRWMYCSSEDVAFTNYLSFGVDASIADRFQHIRVRYPNLFKYPFVNILLYAWCIVLELFNPTVYSLSHLNVVADSKSIPVAGFKSVLFLNIPYFCGGGLPLGEPINPSQSCDQEIEIIGFYNVFHLLAMKFGLSKGVFLGRAKRVEWDLEDTCFVQADGESWVEASSHGEIRFSSSLDVLVP